MTATNAASGAGLLTLPFLHKNPRSQRISSLEVREVFADEAARSMPRGMDRDEYLKKVMP